METEIPDLESLNQQQSLKIIREMIEVSRKKLKNDGILFILWGWAMFFNYLVGYFQRTTVMTYNLNRILQLLTAIVMIFTFGFTIYQIIRQLRKIQTYIGISLRYVWFGLFLCLSLISIILSNTLHKAWLEVQHPIFMVFIAYSIVITGGILRHRLLILGGIIFALLAFVCSYLKLESQMLIEAAAWLIAFIIPGHIMYFKRKE